MTNATDNVTSLWQAALKKRKNKEGESEIVPNAGNAALLLTHHDDFKGCLAYDAFAYRTIVRHELPAVPGLISPSPGDLSDQHVIYCCTALGFKLKGPSWSFESVSRGIELAAQQNSFNPVVDWFSSLAWDEEPRLSPWLHSYLGAEKNAYSMRVGRWFLISAVARAFDPGCQADHVLVLEGRQGRGKSTAARILGGKWTLEKMPRLRDYDRAAHALSGKLIVEIGELEAMRGAAVTEIREFLSLRNDTYRPPWFRHPVTRPRTCVAIATTNERAWQRDQSGARRFWPVAVKKLDRSALVNDRDQLWAEAVAAYRSGEPWWPDEVDSEYLEPEQDDRREVDAWEELVEHWAEGKDGFTTGEVLGFCLNIDRAKWGKEEQTRVGTILTRLGFKRTRLRDQGVRVYRYYREE